ncbi:hypothetical protein [Nonomuraea sp. NPDC048916]|uniref:glycine-rich domain-containing protein n=1 Tax=Nonomuraea sp. NPDC048916 TaxID=3154232 RepID=UPI0033F4DB21
MTTKTAGAEPVIARNLISPDLFDRLAADIARDHNMTIEHAERTMEQALAFLYACALNPGAALAPSPQVDIGWHAYILHTAAYADFCQKVAGRFIHHAPDQPGEISHAARLERLGATVQAIRSSGMPLDTDLWLLPAECSQCHQGCYDDPTPNGGISR